MTQVSAAGTQFIASHEGFASKAYLCPAGVITIGFGFTNRSKIVANWWQERYGRPLRMGDTIDRSAADSLLTALLNHEYGAAVPVKVGNQPQHRHDACASVSFNCGTGSLGWKWAKALAAGIVPEAARLLRSTATTANGRVLPGLVRRRKEEASLLETGNYGRSSVTDLTPRSASTDPADVKWYQERLAKLGYPATLDGVKKFQKDNGLLPDGIVGPATRATIIRRLDAKQANTQTGTAGGGGAVAGGAVDPSTGADILISALLWGAGIAAVVFLIWLFVRYRGRLTGQRVPT